MEQSLLEGYRALNALSPRLPNFGAPGKFLGSRLRSFNSGGGLFRIAFRKKEMAIQRLKEGMLWG
jgi:hypothetical protein